MVRILLPPVASLRTFGSSPIVAAGCGYRASPRYCRTTGSDSTPVVSSPWRWPRVRAGSLSITCTRIDLVGHVLGQEQWEVLSFPAIAETDEEAIAIGKSPA